jgi:hypothetical protein
VIHVHDGKGAAIFGFICQKILAKKPHFFMLSLNVKPFSSKKKGETFIPVMSAFIVSI